MVEKFHCGRCCTGEAVGLSCGVEDRLRGPFAVRGSTVVGGFIVNCGGRLFVMVENLIKSGFALPFHRKA